jgi:Protein of unknown function (DUF1566)
MQQASTLLLALSAAFLVVACGGGSGTATTDTTATAGTTPSPTPTPAPTPSATPTPTPAPTPTSVYRLVGSYDKTECVFDISTGLTWEGKPTGGFRAFSNSYTNYDDATKLQKYSYATQMTTAPKLSDINASTNTIGYVNAINKMGLCGYTNWRMPTLNELLTLNISGSADIKESLSQEILDWFPNTFRTWLWTSTPDPLNDPGAYTLRFGNTDYHLPSGRQGLFEIRLVR